MAKYRGKLYLSTELDEGPYVNPLWSNVGNVSISSIYTGARNTYTVEGESVVYGNMVPVSNGTSQQTTFWTNYKSTFSAATGALLFSANPKIKPPVTYDMANSAGRFWDSTKEIFYDTQTQGSSTRIENPFIIGQRPTDGKYYVLSFTYDWTNQSGIGPSCIVRMYIYTETKNSSGQRTSWSYTEGPFSQAWPVSQTSSQAEGSFSRSYSEQQEFTNVYIATGSWSDGFNTFQGRYIVGGVNDSGEPFPNINSSSKTSFVYFITETCFTGKIEEVPEYGPEPESNKGDGFKVPEAKRDTNDKRVSADFSPYGLNSTYTAHVILDDYGYTSLIAAIFGNTTFWESTPSIIDTNIQGNPALAAKTAQEIASKIISGFGGQVTDSLITNVKSSLGIDTEVKQSMVDSILSLNIFPQIFTGTSGSITTVGGYALKTAIACQPLSHEIVHKEATITIPLYNYSFLGFEPYVSVSVYCPYIGTVPISPSFLYGNRFGTATVELAYAIDSFTGLCSCEIRLNNGSGFYTYCVKQGNCASSVPIIGSGRSGEGTKSIISGLAAIAGSATSLASGNIIGGFTSGISGITDLIRGTSTSNAQQIIQGSSQANIAAMLCPTTPMAYISYKYPAMPNPTEYDDILGGMTNGHGSIGAFSGYCEFYDANLSTVPATQAVKEQILARLKSGVII